MRTGIIVDQYYIPIDLTYGSKDVQKNLLKIVNFKGARAMRR